MAKISKINIAITGDAKGFAAATDAAVREMRRLQAQSETTSRRLGSMKSTINQAATSLSKLGATPGFGALSGALGLAQTAMSGPLGAVAVTGGLASAGVLGAVTAAQQINDVTARAKKALEEVALDGRKRIEESGFSALVASNIAAQGFGTKTAGQNLGIWDSFWAGLASTKGGAVAGDLISNLAPAAAMGAGTLLGGGGINKALQQAGAQMLSGDAVQDAMSSYNMTMAVNSPGGPVGYIIGNMMSK